MKSVLQAAWLLTIAFGNIIVIIVAQFSGLAQVCTKRSRSTCLPKDFPPSSSAALPPPLWFATFPTQPSVLNIDFAMKIGM